MNVNVQDLIKRHFWVVGALTVVICTFYGGRAVAHIIEGKALVDAAKAPKIDPVASATAQPSNAARSKSGKPLADRNIFCAECLPPVPVATDTGPVSSDGGIPMTDLPLVLIATFVADDFAMATVFNTSTMAQGGYTVGDEIPGAGKVDAIYYKFVDFTNTTRNRKERISLLGDIKAPPAPSEPVAVAQADTGPKDEMQAALDSGIKKLDDSTFEVDRALIDKLLQNPLAASKGARVTPSIKNGKPNGIKLYAIRPSSVYAKLGLANGDTIHSINGNELDSLDKGLEIYQKVKDATSLQVQVTRRGKPMSINYTIK